MERAILIDADGDYIYGRAYLPATGISVCVIFCGPVGMEWAHSQLPLIHICRALAANGYLAIRFDYSGTGESYGNFEESNFFTMRSDLSRVIKYVGKTFGDIRIYLAGIRIGGPVAISLAADYRISAVYLIDPVLDPGKYWKELVMAGSKVPGNAAAGKGTQLNYGGYIFTQELLASFGYINEGYMRMNAGKFRKIIFSKRGYSGNRKTGQQLQDWLHKGAVNVDEELVAIWNRQCLSAGNFCDKILDLLE